MSINLRGVVLEDGVIGSPTGRFRVRDKPLLGSPLSTHAVLLIVGLIFWHKPAMAVSPPAHAGWQIVSSASDLIDNAYWDALSYENRPDASVSVTNGTLT